MSAIIGLLEDTSHRVLQAAEVNGQADLSVRTARLHRLRPVAREVALADTWIPSHGAVAGALRHQLVRADRPLPCAVERLVA